MDGSSDSTKNISSKTGQRARQGRKGCAAGKSGSSHETRRQPLRASKTWSKQSVYRKFSGEKACSFWESDWRGKPYLRSAGLRSSEIGRGHFPSLLEVQIPHQVESDMLCSTIGRLNFADQLGRAIESSWRSIFQCACNELAITVLLVGCPCIGAVSNDCSVICKDFNDWNHLIASFRIRGTPRIETVELLEDDILASKRGRTPAKERRDMRAIQKPIFTKWQSSHSKRWACSAAHL